MSIKVVALDIYGTVLAFDDREFLFPPRKGIEDFLDYCQDREIKVVTSSDGDTDDVKRNLSMSFNVKIEAIKEPEKRAEMEKRLNIRRFDAFFKLDQGKKDFSIILGHYDIIPSNLLVIGDNPFKDVYSALTFGANAILCPMYGVSQGEDWDFGNIRL